RRQGSSRTSTCTSPGSWPDRRLTGGRATRHTPARYRGRMALPRFRYSRWDGTQVGFEVDADTVFEQITDDLLYHGDLNAALRRLLHSGFRDRDGRMVEGMRDMLERLRRERQERLDRFDLGGVYDEIAEELR